MRPHARALRGDPARHIGCSAGARDAERPPLATVFFGSVGVLLGVDVSDAHRRQRPVLVVGVDLGPGSVSAMRHAFAMLGSRTASEAHFVHVVQPDAPMSRGALGEIADGLAGSLPMLASSVPHHAPAWVHVRTGSVALEIRRLAFDVAADIIVVGGDAREPGDDDEFAPFSVLRAGSALAMTARRFRASQCEECQRLRALPGAFSPWCLHHQRPGVCVLRVELPDDEQGSRYVQ